MEQVPWNEDEWGALTEGDQPPEVPYDPWGQDPNRSRLQIPAASSDTEYLLREAIKRAALAYPPARLPVALLSLIEDQPAPGTLSPPVSQGMQYLQWLENLAAVLGWRGNIRLKQPGGKQPYEAQTLDPTTAYRKSKEALEARKAQSLPAEERMWTYLPVPGEASQDRYAKALERIKQSALEDEGPITFTLPPLPGD